MPSEKAESKEISPNDQGVENNEKLDADLLKRLKESFYSNKEDDTKKGILNLSHWKEKLNISDESFSKVAQETINEMIDSWEDKKFKIDNIAQIVEEYNLLEVTRDPKIIEFVKEKVKDKLLFMERWDEFESIDKLIKTFHIEESFPKLCEQVILELIPRAGGLPVDITLAIFEKYKLNKDFLDTPEIQESAKRGMAMNLNYGNINSVTKYKKLFNFPEDALHTPEMQGFAEEGIINMLEIDKGEHSFRDNNNYLKALQIVEECKIPEHMLLTARVQAAAENLIINQLDKRIAKIDMIKKIQEVFHISQDSINHLFEQRIKNQELQKNSSNAKETRETYELLKAA